MCCKVFYLFIQRAANALYIFLDDYMYIDGKFYTQ